MATKAPSSRITTIAAVEKSGIWQSAKSAGVNSGLICYWRKQGLLNHPEDTITHRVRLDCSGPVSSYVRSVTFYRVSKLNSIRKRTPNEKRQEKGKAFRRSQERIDVAGIEHLRAGVAATLLGIQKESLAYWTRSPIESFHLPFITRKVAGRATKYYSAIDLGRLKRLLVAEPAIPAGEVPLKEACRLAGCRPARLTNPTWCIANKITQHKQLAKNASRGRRRVIYSFVRSDLVAFASQFVVQIPEGHMTCAVAAKRLRLSLTAVKGLCREGILKATWGDVAIIRHARRQGWLPTVESVEWVWSIIQKAPNKIRAGWMLREAARARDATKPTSAAQPGTPAPKGGRPRDLRTAEIYAMCFELRKTKKAISVMNAVNAKFGANTITEVSTVRKYARRHAERLETKG